MPQHYRGPSPQGKTSRTSKSTNGASQANAAHGVSAAHGEGRVRSVKAAHGGPRAHGEPQSFPQGAYSAVKPAGAQRGNPSSTSQYSRSNPNYQKKNR